VLGQRLERGLYDLLAKLVQAKYSRERTPLLDNANLKLEILRFQMRLAKDLECRQVKSEVQATANDCELMPAEPPLPRSQPAIGLRRQPELCQQAAEVMIRMGVQ